MCLLQYSRMTTRLQHDVWRKHLEPLDDNSSLTGVALVNPSDNAPPPLAKGRSPNADTSGMKEAPANAARLGVSRAEA
jgi:hypothetical protein